MEEKELKLSVNDLKISFRTKGGKVQAVRNISFDLHKGETLAIVGESGSGKSVTTRAILGILAGNAIKEGGEIIYDGQDLMKISEEEFHRLRGDKIAMIFQDPLSSLNPIVRIGKQMTEAMLIKGKLNQKESRKDFNQMLKYLNQNMDASRGDEFKAENKQKCDDFNRFEVKHLSLELPYNRAVDAARDALGSIEDILFRIEKSAYLNVIRDVREACRRAKHSINRYVVHARAEELQKEIAIATTVSHYKMIANHLNKIKDILSEALSFDTPNFFAMGYYLTFANEPLPEMSVKELNAFMHDYLGEHFMYNFISLAQNAIKHSHDTSVARMRAVLPLLDKSVEFFRSANIEKGTANIMLGNLISSVNNTIDRLEIVKDNLAYTFASSIKSAAKIYFDGIKSNEKDELRYARQKARYDRIVASGKTPNYQVAEKNLVDLDAAKENIVNIILRIKDDFEKKIAENDIDYSEKANNLIDYLKDKASNVAYKVTKSMAKLRALKLMEEVGIPEPRKRFTQYPFEFSGGMRQRIVIAIALSADPDILICDEPTTALDVTIQSQILELINKVKNERKLSVIFITHDLGVVANMADRVAVMYAGKIVEIGTAEDLFYSPAHPYTWALLSSMPDLDTKEKLDAIPGTPPNMIYPPKGDAFAERNKYAMQIDFEEQPPMFKISDTHYAATWLLHPDAPKVNPPKSVTDRIARMKNAGGEQNEQTK